MKSKILIRTGMLPTESIGVIDMLKKDRTGSNIGNLIYQYGVIRSLLTENTEIYSDRYVIDPKKADEINEKYDAYVIPLADAFREDFRPSLRKYTQLINKLSIPVYVIGAGLRAPLGFDINSGFSFDEDVKNFVKAVLNKSAKLGLRGQITADYLSKLGFKEGEEHQVIGCPSMYTFGRNLSLKKPQINENSFISINASNISNKSEMDFLNKVSEQYQNHCFIPQVYPELFLTYLGGPDVGNAIQEYPKDIQSSFYLSGKVKFFLNAPSWFNYMNEADISVGTRLHGNIVATLCNIPNITIVRDSRMKELADFHSLPHIMSKDINSKTNILDLIDNLDFERVNKTQKINFDNFVDFLNINGLRNIYSDNLNRKDAPLDYMVENIIYDKPITPITIANNIEKISRLNLGLNIMQEKFNKNKEAALKAKDRVILSLKK